MINPETALVGDEIGGYRIAAETTILQSSPATQRDPRFWPECNRYNPDSFLSDEADLRAFVPSVRGQRLCLGCR
ncbi:MULTISPECIES: cytochrome P450 [unclassified Mycobacteroides]|uniref:cytochrome P450 n=1 Tax=unclassified Mycobacteroides TaxID=2618759 RepID=UPI0035C7CD26